MAHTYTYITSELAEKTDKQSIINAYQHGDLEVTVIDDEVYFFQTCESSSVWLTAREEIEKYYPHLTYLYGIKDRRTIYEYESNRNPDS